MKVWIDKQGGMHYHKDGCRMMNGIIGGFKPTYEQIEHRIRDSKRGYFYDIIVDDRRYRPCPLCFGHGERK